MYKKIISFILMSSLLFTGCSSANSTANGLNYEVRELNTIDDHYRNYYEVFVYSFCDSNGDGIGDLKGVEEKLDYISDLGFNGIWLMPIMPSTTYHKYDVTDYMDIDSEYGSMDDFDSLISACHEKGINVIIDLPINHTSSSHPWFQEAVSFLSEHADETEEDMDISACPYVEYYHFSNTPESGYTNIEGTSWYYESQFWSEMPDLNLENESVRAELEEVADFWMDHGVDGFRMDAVKEFVSGNTDVNTEILSWFSNYVHTKDPNSYIVCECWTDQNTYARYYQSGVDSMFDFAFSGREGVISMAVNGQKSASSYANRMEEEEALYSSYNEAYINAPFYTNHDLARSASYYSGENSEAQVKIAQAMNILMGGNVFVYYGEELGMKGSGKDENKRAPMQWSSDPDLDGMCTGPIDMDNIEMKYGSYEEQKDDDASIYRYVKEALEIRNTNPEIARGETIFLEQDSSDEIFAYAKDYEGSKVYVIGNLSAETVETSVETFDPSALSVSGELYTGEETAAYQDDILTMPAYSILVFYETTE